MKVRIGINPITWTNDDVPELGGDTPLETCLAETKQAGYAGTELGGKFPRQSAVLKPIMARYGLAVISGWYDGRCDEKDVAEEMDAIAPASAIAEGHGLQPCGLCRYLARPPRRHLGTDLAAAQPCRPRSGRPMAANSPHWPSAWPISACAWPSITTWAPSSKPMRKLAC